MHSCRYQMIGSRKWTWCAVFLRTGSKLGISPLMLAAMNGHTSTVKLLLDMGSDINAQVNSSQCTGMVEPQYISNMLCWNGVHFVNLYSIHVNLPRIPVKLKQHKRKRLNLHTESSVALCWCLSTCSVARNTTKASSSSHMTCQSTFPYKLLLEIEPSMEDRRKVNRR